MEENNTNKKCTLLKHQDLYDLRKQVESLDAPCLDADILSKGLEIAGYYIENGFIKFLDFSHQMLKDLGNSIRPYLKTFYSGVRYCPGMESFSDEMSSVEFVDKIDVGGIKQDNMFYHKSWRFAFGLWHATEFIERGFYLIEDYAELIIKDMGDSLRPDITSLYEQARSYYMSHKQQDVLEEMSSKDFVKKFDPNNFDKVFVLRCDYYAPKNPSFLTIATHPGVLNKYDILENLVLMGIMSEQEEKHGEVDASRALSIREGMNGQELMDLAASSRSYWYDSEWERVWNSYNLIPQDATTLDGDEIPLFPIEEVFKCDEKTQAENMMIEMLEDSFLQRFWEYIEWDHTGPDGE